MLTLESVQAYYGESHILHGISVSVQAGEILALIGRNGMGKTTVLRSIMGLTDVRSGHITLEGRDISRLPPYQVARSGCAFVPDDRGIFPRLSVLEHLRLGPLALGRRTDLTPILRRFPLLKERARQRADSLSGGERAILAIARSLAVQPRVLLIDELTEGVQPSVVCELGRLLREVAAMGIAVIVVDQDARFALQLADTGCVLEKGCAVLVGPATDLLAQQDLLHRYLVV